ncbi:MAG: hypothetical protein ACREOZ_01110, partial [Gloeomargaritales cyanobacterium]
MSSIEYIDGRDGSGPVRIDQWNNANDVAWKSYLHRVEEVGQLVIDPEHARHDLFAFCHDFLLQHRTTDTHIQTCTDLALA